MTLLEQLAQAKARLKELIAGRPQVYRAWSETWTTYHEDPTAYHKAYDNLYRYDVEKNKVLDEVKQWDEWKAKQDKRVWTFWDLSGGDIVDAIKTKLKEKNT